jgi:ABC-type arginine transport system ATPase subunit
VQPGPGHYDRPLAKSQADKLLADLKAGKQDALTAAGLTLSASKTVAVNASCLPALRSASSLSACDFACWVALSCFRVSAITQIADTLKHDKATQQAKSQADKLLADLKAGKQDDCFRLMLADAQHKGPVTVDADDVRVIARCTILPDQAKRPATITNRWRVPSRLPA